MSKSHYFICDKTAGGDTNILLMALKPTGHGVSMCRNNFQPWVVDKIAFVPPLQQEKYNELIDASVQEVRKAKGFENATADNFQLVPGGKIELLLGLDAGSDFFPKEISNFKSGLKVSQYRMNMFDPARTLGFSGSFPAKYAPMYLPADHPKTLIMQEDPKIDNASVFRTSASVTMIR